MEIYYLTELLDSNLTQVDANVEIKTEHVNAIAFKDAQILMQS